MQGRLHRTTPLLALLAAAAALLAAGDLPKQADFLLVQSAKEVSYENGTLTLKGVDPATIMFSDRPERIAGHMATSEFLPFWKEGKDSFLSDPPNATVSFLGGDQAREVVVELSDPVLSGDTLTYHVAVLQGTMPPKAGVASLFIDIIGMPLTPISYAGAYRRAWRRGVY